jgi:hypothetical protein
MDPRQRGYQKDFGRFYLLIRWMTFCGVLQIMDNDLTHRGVWRSGGGQIVAAGIAKSGGDNTCVALMVVLQAPSLELRGESLGQTRVVIPGNGDVLYVVTLLEALLGYVQTVSSG